MSVHRKALLLLAGVAALNFAVAPGASAQKYNYYKRGDYTHRTITPRHTAPPTHSSPNRGRPHRGGDGGHHDGGGLDAGTAIGIGIAIGTIIQSLPKDQPRPGGGHFIDNGTIDEPVDHRHVRRHLRHRQSPPQRTTRRGPSGAPPAGETRLVPDEVVIEVSNRATARQITALQRRFRLQRIESHRFALTGTTFFRWRIPDRRSVASVIRALERDRLVASAQPNYLYKMQQSAPEAGNEGRSAQYALAKLHLPQAHTIATGKDVRVAVIDSAVDLASPELTGSIAGHFDTLTSPRKAHAHGTSIAVLIAGHGMLTGAAPGAQILAVRAFDPDAQGGAQGSTFNILRGLDWAVQHHARIINMSFAGPPDPALSRALQVANRKGIVLIAAAGNAGPKSPPLYPAADPEVIAVSATDPDDHLLEQSNRGRQIALAAPGKDILVALPGGRIEVSSGTSYSAAEVSGVAALLIQRDGKLTPTRLRRLMQESAKDLGPKGRDPLFGYGLANAYAALAREGAQLTAELPTENVPLPVSRVSTHAR
ncbi:MAG: S8 family serine peptidase [Pseudolabrys sp.]